jgi:flagellin-specific chaperone FliS
MELKEKIEERFKQLNALYERQVKETLALKESLKNSEAKANSIAGQLEELQVIYREVTKEEEIKPKEKAKEVKNDKEPDKK